MHSTLTFSSRYALNTMHATLIFQNTINRFTSNFERNLFKTTSCTFIHSNDLDFPAFTLTIALVHTEQITSKYGALVTSSALTNFDKSVLIIFWIFRYQ